MSPRTARAPEDERGGRRAGEHPRRVASSRARPAACRRRRLGQRRPRRPAVGQRPRSPSPFPPSPTTSHSAPRSAASPSTGHPRGSVREAGREGHSLKLQPRAPRDREPARLPAPHVGRRPELQGYLGLVLVSPPRPKPGTVLGRDSSGDRAGPTSIPQSRGTRTSQSRRAYARPKGLGRPDRRSCQ